MKPAKIVDAAGEPAAGGPAVGAFRALGKDAVVKGGLGRALEQDGLVDAAELHGHAQGDGLFDGFSGGRDDRAEPAAGVSFNFAGRLVLGLDDDRQAAGMLDEDVGALARGVL